MVFILVCVTCLHMDYFCEILDCGVVWAKYLFEEISASQTLLNRRIESTIHLRYNPYGAGPSF